MLSVTFMSSHAQLIANFSANTVQGCGPTPGLPVSFKDQSTGSPTAWTWDLGNGAISTDQNPGAIYITPGKYTVTLTIKNASGQNKISKQDYIVVNTSPSIAFNASPLQGCAPLNVSFVDKSLPGSGNITNWIWDFGDGTTDSLQNPVHAYSVSDTFDVTLSVKNSNGCKQIFQNKGLIKIAGLVKSNFIYSYIDVCKPPSTVNFTNTSISNGPMSFQWDFGDGKSSTEANPQHVYLSAGNFTVKLIVHNQNGCSDTYQQVIAIGLAKADFSYSNACVNQPVLFTDSSSPKPVTETWDFGDGVTQSGNIVSHVYNGANTFTVTLTANFGNCISTTKKTIVTGQKPTAAFSVSGNTKTCTYPVTLHFTNTSTGAVTYKWLFGDGSTADISDPDYTYTATGSYSVTLIAFNTNGCPDTLTLSNIVQLGPPKILGIDSIPLEGCVPQIVTFNPQIFAPDPISTYKWTFGDGSTSAEPKPTHNYVHSGTYNVTLVIATAKGCSDSLTIINAVLIGKHPYAKFEAKPLASCAGDSIQFTDESKGTITGWQWFFGDEGTSALQNPSYYYKDTGTFSVKLVVNDYGCYDTLILKNYVHLKPPVAIFTYSAACSNPLSYKFTDGSIDPETWLWNFGDGKTATTPNPNHVYSNTGIYPITLTVTNGACSYIRHDTLNVINEHPSFTFTSQSNFCKYDSVKFHATNYQPGNIKSFYWDFGDSTNAGFDYNLDTVFHTYSISGNYKPYMVAKDLNDCIDTIDLKLPLEIYGPTAAFSNKSGNCIGTNINFVDKSHSDGVHNITQWIWNFGDSSLPDTLSALPVFHTYSKAGYYSVYLKVKDANGCYDTIENLSAVNITKPVAAFAVDSLSCTGNAVQFADSSFGVSKTYKWDFGDNNTSSEANPQHIYNAEGLYNIKMVVTDINGCTDSLIKPSFIRVADPFASFTIPDSLFTCPPARIEPLGFSKNYASLTWDFGDNNTSSELNPVHYYTTAGNYVLTLTAQGYGTSCISTVSKNISLKGPKAKLSYTPFSGCNPLKTDFHASAKNTVAYIWDFGDGSTQTTTDSLKNYTYTSTGKFLPQLIIVDSGGCRVPVVNNDTIVVFGANAKFGIDQGLTGCDSLNVSFIDSSTALFDEIKSYAWQFGDGGSSGVINPLHAYLKSGLYNPQLIITTEKGCVSSDTLPLNINIDPKPVANAVIPDSACINSPLTFNASVNNAFPDISWHWYTGDGDSVLIQNPTYTYSKAGNFIVKLIVSALAGCADTVQQALTINPAPVIDAGAGVVVCLGKNTILSPSGAQSYTWTQDKTLSCINCENPIALPLQSTQYYVSGKNIFGCTSTDSVDVQIIQPAKILLSNNDSVCAGSTINLSASGEDFYTWEPANLLSQASGAQTTSKPVTNTTYTVIGSDSKGCFSDTASVTVYVFPYPQIQIPDSLVVIQGGTDYTINATGSEDIVSWQWTPVKWLSCFTCAQPVSSPKSTITYTVAAQNIAGCLAEKNITITVLCKNNNMYIPNTFSPNHDGINDYFYPRGKGFTVKSFRIFSRWGNPVFEQHNFVPDNQSFGWDGTYKNSVLQPDVYVYMIEVLCDNGTLITTKGNITLLR